MTTSNRQQLQEVRIHGTSTFPCALYYRLGAFGRLQGKYHWHKEIELLYLASGSFKINIDMKTYELQQESFVFINSGQLHSLSSLTSDYAQQTLVFDPQMLRFRNYDSIDEGLLHPLVQGSLTFPLFLSADHPAFAAFRQEFLQLTSYFSRHQQIIKNGKQIYVTDISDQLQIKISLLKLVALLSEHNLMSHSLCNENLRIAALKTVFSYISGHYQEKVYVRDLAAQVNMNEQYFSRFFKRAIGKSPMNYLNDYRISKVLPLLEDTDLPITTISLDCGFQNIGNFQRLFKQTIGTSPLKYRKQAIAKKSE